ncbi:hypothetical protein, partial [Escherichia coli]|uniref:hypothetical protein n=1 Tax=Escherichia coli TaxID=562 RepID=UPI001954C314
RGLFLMQHQQHGVRAAVTRPRGTGEFRLVTNKRTRGHGSESPGKQKNFPDTDEKAGGLKDWLTEW